MSDSAGTDATPFADLDHYLALPRLGGLALSADGERLVVGVQTLDKDATAWVGSLWDIDPTGARAARRLTRGAKGESSPAFTPDGDLLFVARRGEDDDAVAELHLLPAGGGEPRVVATHPGGVESVATPRTGHAVLVQGSALPRSTDLADEKERRKARKEKKVSAILHADYPVRYWDHDLGPAAPRLYAAEPAGTSPEPAGPAKHRAGPPAAADPLDEPALELRDLTPDAGVTLVETRHVLAPNGTFVVTEVTEPEGGASRRQSVVRIDVATGERTTLLAADEDEEFAVGAVSDDGTRLAYVRERRSTPASAPRPWLAVLDLVTGETRDLTHGWDRWPGETCWLPDGSGLLVVADDDGRAPVFHVDATTGAVTRLTDEGTFSAVTVAPDGLSAYALRSSYAHPPEVVRIDLAGSVATVTALRGPVDRPALPGTLRDVETRAADGTRVRSWLALPDGAGPENPAPLLLWIHGGPLGSWNSWSWRWNPWLMVARGYAVLLPDPALSTGYGQDFVERGWGRWGDTPYTDLMAATDAAEALPEVDDARTAAMGGSFGGYMANWVAGHTDRFRAVVTHASLWDLDAFSGTTDASFYWEREMTAEMRREHSPSTYVADITTPVLVIHGDKDYRVPIGEGLRLWYDLLHASGLPQAPDGTTAHRFLYFPDENHWILTPQHARLWYEVVLGFLAQHVLGEEAPELPQLLG
ncbi:S9 family peptidase [Georgenia sp. M64]|uniref:S9 family peptidase n=1 Tax=Georgenia sp. M64 TaxID=3120520 RepID=UPI0030E303DF